MKEATLVCTGRTVVSGEVVRDAESDGATRAEADGSGL